jgi:hypothetical protein
VKLEGSLDAFSLPDIFALLAMTKKTGGLHLRRAGAHGAVWFAGGSLTGGASDVARQALGRRLVGAGHVDDAALAAAVNLVERDAASGLAPALLTAGAVQQQVLHEVVSEHIIDTVFDLLRWPDGDFAFTVDEANPDDVGVTLAADDVVAEARRRLETWASVAGSVPSPHTVLSMSTLLVDEPHLTREEWRLVALVDGRRTVGELVAVCGRGEYVVVSTLADLVQRGLLRAEEDDGVATLVRRQQLLAQLEAPTLAPSLLVEPASPTVSLVTSEPADSDDDTDDDDADESVGESDDDIGDDTDDEVPSRPAAPSPRAARADAEARRPIASHPGDVTPTRPEPFLPKRRPEHPEPSPVGQMAAVVGGAAVAATPLTQIERDPSVNKSLLLRLIAGVRGL